MQKYITNIRNTEVGALRALRCARTRAALLFGVLLLTCCKNDEIPPQEVSLQNVSVKMNVGSRMVTTDGLATEAEATLRDLRVYAFVNGQLVGHKHLLSSNKGDSKVDLTNGATKNFFMDLKILSTTTQTVDFYVVGNELAVFYDDVLNEHTTEQQLKQLKYSGADNVANYGLLMYDYKQVTLNVSESTPNTAPGHEGHLMATPAEGEDLNFSLKRPMAKLAVFAAKPDTESGTLVVTGLRVTRGRRSAGYIFPQEDETLKKDVTNLEGTRVLNIADSVAGHKALTTGLTDAERKIATTSNGTMEQGAVNHYAPVQADPYYPFETPYGSSTWNNDTDNKSYVLEVDYHFVDEGGTASETRTGTVYMPRLLRNHYYMVCCTMHNMGMISITYNVAPWESVDYGVLEFEPPVYNYPTPYDPSYPKLENGKWKQPEIYYSQDGSGDFSFNLNIEGPNGLKWSPVLYDLGDSHYGEYDIVVRGKVKDNDNNYKEDVVYTRRTGSSEDPIIFHNDGETGSSVGPYKITIKPAKNEIVPANHDQIIRLGISYTPAWTGKAELLIISGDTQQDIKWEGSDRVQTISIKHVNPPVS